MDLSLIQTGLDMSKFNQILLAASAVLFSSFAVADKLADDTHGVRGWGLNIFNTSGDSDGGIGIAYSTGDMEFGYNTFYAKEERTNPAGAKTDHTFYPAQIYGGKKSEVADSTFMHYGLVYSVFLSDTTDFANDPDGYGFYFGYSFEPNEHISIYAKTSLIGFSEIDFPDLSAIAKIERTSMGADVETGLTYHF